jgi:hypothetical protein
LLVRFVGIAFIGFTFLTSLTIKILTRFSG